MSEATTNKSEYKVNVMSTLPTFLNEKEESDFWDSHDSTEFMDSTEEVDMQFTDNRAAMKQISLRLEQHTINEIKLVAKQKGIGYQTLIRMWVIERLHGEAA